jgi:tetratricopeptide (TPR) repeat protein
LHAGWDFEARRHFAVAMKSDPRCLMAHWGMVMSMFTQSAETDSYRMAATKRLMKLVSDGEGTDLERGFAYALIKYMEEGPDGAEKAFRKIADKFPKDIQSEVFAALFGRGGYNQLGDITPAQEEAEARLAKLVEKLPNNSVPIHALLLVRAEAPDLSAYLPLAYKLCELVPNYPPYVHLLGHYEWRCGEYAKATETFGRASKLYFTWMKENEVTREDCPEWVRAVCYRSAALASQENFDAALFSARQIAKVPANPTRPSSPGTRIILWDAQTIPARILMRRGEPGDAAKALASLPAPEENELYRKHSLFYWWVDGLRFALEGRRLVEAGSLQEASKAALALSQHGQAMAKKRSAAAAIGEYPEWRRALFTLEILTADLQGRIALAGPPEGRGSAFNWFRAAADRQHPATLLNPPLLLSPIATQLGDYFMAIDKPKKAIGAYQEALSMFPNEPKTLGQIKKATAIAEQESE